MKKINVQRINFISSPMQVSLSQIRSFCALSGDAQGFHLDGNKAKDSFFGQIVVPGALVTALAIKTMWEMYTVTKVFLGWEVISLKCEAKYIKSVSLEDIITYSWKTMGSVKEKLIKGTNRPVVTWEVLVRNRKQELLAKHIWTFAYIERK